MVCTNGGYPLLMCIAWFLKLHQVFLTQQNLTSLGSFQVISFRGKMLLKQVVVKEVTLQCYVLGR